MQEKKNLRLLILLPVMTALTVLVYFMQQDEDHANVDPTIFKVEDLTKIDRVELESSRNKVKLSYESPGWKVNERFTADRQMITVLFATFEQVVPKRQVAASQLDSVMERINTSGVTVKLFEGQTLRKEFQVAGDPLKNETYFRLDPKADPYVVTIPGYRVNVSQIFDLEVNAWRDRRIFDFIWRNFQSLKSTFPSDPASNFSIAMNGSYYAVEGMEKSDTTKVNNYLDDLSLLVGDQILSPGVSVGFDSLAKTTPLNTIEIKDIANRTYRLSLFPPLKSEALVLGKAFEGDLVLLDRKKVSKIFQKRAYFKLKDR